MEVIELKARRKRAIVIQELIFLLSFLMGVYLYIDTGNVDLTVTATICFFSVLQLARYFTSEKWRFRHASLEKIDKMDGWQFERFLGELFKKQGYRTKVTRGSGDFGADVILKKNGKKIVVQAKRYNRNVGVKAVQEVQASMGYYKANEGWVVTNSYFTKPAIELANSLGVRLIDRDDLISMTQVSKYKVRSTY